MPELTLATTAEITTELLSRSDFVGYVIDHDASRAQPAPTFDGPFAACTSFVRRNPLQELVRISPSAALTAIGSRLTKPILKLVGESAG